MLRNGKEEMGRVWGDFFISTLFAKEPLQKLSVERKGRYMEITSRTIEGRTYIVDLETMTCECEASKHGLKCWHLEVADLFYGLPKIQLAR